MSPINLIAVISVYNLPHTQIYTQVVFQSHISMELDAWQLMNCRDIVQNFLKNHEMVLCIDQPKWFVKYE